MTTAFHRPITTLTFVMTAQAVMGHAAQGSNTRVAELLKLLDGEQLGTLAAVADTLASLARGTTTARGGSS